MGVRSGKNGERVTIGHLFWRTGQGQESSLAHLPMASVCCSPGGKLAIVPYDGDICVITRDTYATQTTLANTNKITGGACVGLGYGVPTWGLPGVVVWAPDGQHILVAEEFPKSGRALRVYTIELDR